MWLMKSRKMPQGLDPEKILKEQHDSIARIYLRKDEIVETHLLPTFYNGERVMNVIERIKEIRPKGLLLVLVLTDARSVVTWSGLKAVFSRSAVNYSMARAYVFQTYSQFFLARLGKFIVQPKTPMRFFKSRARAEAWLSTFQGHGI